MTDQQSRSLAGQTLRFRFDEGPTAGTTYEHEFSSDGTVMYRDVGSGAKVKAATEGKDKSGVQAPEKAAGGAQAESGRKPGPTKYASYEVGPGMHLVSYLSEAGYTLTVLVNTNDGKLHGFASSSKEWYPLTGELQPAD